MILADTHVLLDIATKDPNWASGSIEHLDAAAIRGPLGINAVIYSEFSVGYDQIEDVERLLKGVDVAWAEIPREALFLAGKAFQQYRRQGEPNGGPAGLFIGACRYVGDRSVDPRSQAVSFILPEGQPDLPRLTTAHSHDVAPSS